MRKPIIGATVGTSISPQKVEDVINPVKTVNGISPDENGNVQITVSGGSNVQTEIAVGINLRGMTVDFMLVNGVSGTGYEVMFKAGDDFEIFAEEDYYQVTIGGVTEGQGTGYFDAFSYTYPDDKDYFVSVYDTNAVKATARIEYAKKSDIPTDEHIKELIREALGVVENGTY